MQNTKLAITGQRLIDMALSILQKKQQLENIKQSLTADVKEYVQNTSIPLEDRWEVFKKCGVGKEESYIQHIIFNGEDICDTEPFSKYETIFLVNVVENKEDDLQYYKDVDFTRESIEAFKEEVLNQFIWSFEYDW